MIRIKHFLILSLLTTWYLSPLHGQIDNGQTYALVVGVSQYQDSTLNLKYADKDAQLFAEFLKSDAGGRLNKDQLTVLLNGNASYGNVGGALTQLMNKIKPGDKAIIYFSGHGDVESSLDTKPGYLLLWDASQSNYIFGGALPINTLQNIISTISSVGSVIIIADACRSGNLAGGQEGQEITGATLASKLQNEIKILSCQANEQSMEGEKWGGGHGAFSYHLVRGLYGLADKDNSFDVTLGELEDYLEDNVTPSVIPHKQNPDVDGLNDFFLTDVFQSLKDSIIQADTFQLNTDFEDIAARGFEAALSSSSEVSLDAYKEFNRSIEAGQFFHPENDCAEHYFKQLEDNDDIADLLPDLRIKYAAALQNNAQQVLNKILKSDMDELLKSKNTKVQDYQDFPRQLERASSLLGEGHFLDSTLIGRKLFFEGFMISAQNTNYDTVVGRESLNKLFQSLDYLPAAPISYLYISKVYGYNMDMIDSSKYYADLAGIQSPKWVLPMTSMSYLYSKKYKNVEASEDYLKEADKRNPNSIFVLNAWGNHFSYAGQLDKASDKYQQSLAIDSSFSFAYINNGVVNHRQGKYKEAEINYNKALRIDSTTALVHNNLGALYKSTDQPELAIKSYKSAINNDSLYTRSMGNLGALYIDLEKYKKARKILKRAIRINPRYRDAYYNMAILHDRQENGKRAEHYFRKTIGLDSSHMASYHSIAELNIADKKYNQAEQILLEAIAIDGNSVFAYELLNRVFVAENRIEDGLIILSKLTLDHSDSPYPIYSSARLQAIAGEKENAYKSLERALQIGSISKKNLKEEADFEALRIDVSRWNTLLNKYFN